MNIAGHYWKYTGKKTAVMERSVPVYHKTNVQGLQSLLRGKFALWASNGSCVKEMWKSFK